MYSVATGSAHDREKIKFFFRWPSSTETISLAKEERLRSRYEHASLDYDSGFRVLSFIGRL